MSYALSHKQDLSLDGPIQLILCSQSPRRGDILDMMGLKDRYHRQPSLLDEEKLHMVLSKEDPIQYTKTLAEEKARANIKIQSGNAASILLGSDTIVDLEGSVLEKPKSEAQAKEMLLQLSGKAHQVHTGVALFLVPKTGEPTLVSSFVDTAHVLFSELSRQDIDDYVATGEPMDKAGSYGIQGSGGQFVKQVTGDFFTVMGLPMHRTSVELSRAIKQALDLR